MAPQSSVVIVSYRPGTWLAPCLASALSQADEVIVVDNGSDDATASAIARRAGAAVARSPRNLGFAAGVNLGLRRARGDVVGLLNDDAVAGPTWMARARTVLADPAVAAVTPKVLLAGLYAEVVLDDEAWFSPGDVRPLGRMLRSVTVDGTEVLDKVVGAGVHDVEDGTLDGRSTTWRWTAGPLPFYVPVTGGADGAGDGIEVNGAPVGVRTCCRVLNHAGNYLERHGIAGDFGFGAPDDGRFDAPAERFGFSGTAPVFRAETLARVGPLAGPFFAYNEDTDWCLRARLAGLRILYDPGAEVRHHLSATSGGAASAHVRFLAQRNALLCLVRNAPAEVVRGFVWRRMRQGPGSGVRRALVVRLPWALASRLRLRRRWTVDPRQVWDRWAGADTTWDTAPARTRTASSGGGDGAGHQVDETGPGAR
ncbi:MAG: glycosyltransferase family 2 protein [Acidimicrobiales bacterium]